MSTCRHCLSTDTIKKGSYVLADGTLMQRYKCKSCIGSFSTFAQTIDTDEDQDEEILYEDILQPSKSYIRSSQEITQILSKKTLVITSAQNNSQINETFLESLKSYCYEKNASLIVIPVKYKTSQTTDISYDPSIEEYLIENDIDIPEYNTKILGSLKIQATAENPLSGLDAFSKGKTVIIGHSQLQMKTMPTIGNSYPPIITTTGSISNKNYSNTKLGAKASFNHSLSAIVLELDSDCYHIRNLNFDGTGFYDLDKYYFPSGILIGQPADSLITGDEHAVFHDEKVLEATYTREDSLVNILKPNFIVRHDVFDGYSLSHHHSKNVFTKYAKHVSGMDCVQSELNKTLQYIKDTTPPNSVSIIVQSNHNEHLLRWLNECDPKMDPRNAKIYHFLMYLMLSKTEMGEGGASHPDPFELYAERYYGDERGCVRFSDRTTGFTRYDIELGSHGDRGNNGSRGSRKQFSILPNKTVIGHSHSPGIEKSCYQVGTSSKMRLEYNSGASSWHHTHCIIHKNGKRQIVFVTNGKFRL